MTSIGGSETDLQCADGEVVTLAAYAQSTVFQSSYALMDAAGATLNKGALASGRPTTFTLDKTASPLSLSVVGVFSAPDSWYDIELSGSKGGETVSYRNAKPAHGNSNGVTFTINVV